VSEEWTYPPRHFDYIHIREMFGSISDWDKLFREVHRCLIPGGWVEVIEHGVKVKADDDTLPPDHVYHTWSDSCLKLTEKTGKKLQIFEEVKDRLLHAGFVDVVEVPFNWPVNGWSSNPKLKELGRWNQYRLHEGVEGYVLRLLTTVGGVRCSTNTMEFKS
jgi:hypothetical protein